MEHRIDHMLDLVATHKNKEAEHLTVDQILDFVSIDKLDEKSMALASAVTTHMRECKRCFKLVNTALLIAEKFDNLQNDESVRRNIIDAINLDTELDDDADLDDNM